ncbi:MAG: YchJ family metal-binding protein [Sideroxydans sp.]|nr:YchJ family metal-binding protein [Sideroxydans sp.]
MNKQSTNCPCGSTKPFTACCAPYVEGNVPAPTAEALMRSRYTAYTLLREDYLLATWHTSTRPASLELAADTATKWIGLEVKRHEQQDTDHAIVEFVARYKVNGRAHRLHEVSRFVREDGRWFYLDGDLD